MSHLVNTRVPHCNIFIWKKNGPKKITTTEYFANRDVVLFSIPGAFTPTCTTKHVPSYIKFSDKFSDMNIDTACLSVNDIFVMNAFR